MAVDDGIKGESLDPGCREVTSAQWGVKQLKSATASTAGGHTAKRCEHKTIAITKLADPASPSLYLFDGENPTEGQA
jgi:type VI secretion system secreted protein Hcp